MTSPKVKKAIIGIMGLIVVILLACVVKGSFRKEASSIGIIGGADGSTAIFVSGKMTNLIAACSIGAIFFVVAVVLIVVLLIKGRK